MNFPSDSASIPYGGLLLRTADLPGGRLALANPEALAAERYSGTAYRIPAEIFGSYACAHDPSWVMVPAGMRGNLHPVQAISHPVVRRITPEQRLEISLLPPIRLRPYQQAAVQAAMNARCGLLVMPPGAGKTITALMLAHRLRLRPLVLVHTKDLMQQWVEASLKVFNAPLNQIGGGKITIGSPIGSVAMLQTLATWSRERLEQLTPTHGVLFADECHRCPAQTIMEVLWHLGPPYRYGLTATPTRADGLTPLLHWALGPILAEVTTGDLVEAGVSVQPLVRRIDTSFSFDLLKAVQVAGGYTRWSRRITPRQPVDISSIAWDVRTLCDRAARVTVPGLSADDAADLTAQLKPGGYTITEITDTASLAECAQTLIADAERLDLVCKIAQEMLAEGRKVLVLSGRVAHAEDIAAELLRRGAQAAVLNGKMATRKRTAVLEAFRAGSLDVVVATTLADEGLDVPDLTGMIMAFPGRSEAKTIQRVGRSMRAVPGKSRPLIIDLVDGQIGLYVNQWHARRRAYKKAGCEIERPAKQAAKGSQGEV